MKPLDPPVPRAGLILRRTLLAVPAAFVTGCDPIVNFYGSYFPAWVICLAAGVVLTVLFRWVFAVLRIERHLGPLVLIYPALALLLTCATWLWLFGP